MPTKRIGYDDWFKGRLGSSAVAGTVPSLHYASRLTLRLFCSFNSFWRREIRKHVVIRWAIAALSIVLVARSINWDATEDYVKPPMRGDGDPGVVKVSNTFVDTLKRYVSADYTLIELTLRIGGFLLLACLIGYCVAANANRSPYKRVRFSLSDAIVGIASVTMSIAVFVGLSSYAIYYDNLPTGGRQPRTLWPSDAPLIESFGLVTLIFLLIFLPLNSIVQNTQKPFFKISAVYWLLWILCFVNYLIWYCSRSFPWY